MKKYVIGIIIGVTLAISSQAVAGTTSNMGKKVQAEYIVTVDGGSLDVKAVNIGGVTMSPNRALADAVGYNIALENGVVVFTKKKEAVVGVDSEAVTNELDKINARLKTLQAEISKIQLEGMTLPLKYMNDPETYAIKKGELEERGKPLQDELDTLNLRKAALEAQQ